MIFDNPGGPRLFAIWDHLFKQVKELDREMLKVIKRGNLSAGIRTRKKLKELIRQTKFLSDEMMKNDKAIFQRRKKMRLEQVRKQEKE